MGLFFNFKQGDRGQSVADLQAQLNMVKKEKLVIDGIYGRLTDKAVRKIANQFDSPSAAAGPAVWQELGIPQIAIADISDHQYKVDFFKLRHEGISGVILKASEGFDWKTKNPQRFKEAKEAGLLVGAYHFGRPDLHSEHDAPARERANFDEVIEDAGIDLDFLPIYDFEKGDKTRDSWNVKYAVEWRPGIIYTAQWAINLLASEDRERLVECGAKLWFADYVRDHVQTGPKDKIKPWCQWHLWQHTASYLSTSVHDYKGSPSKIDMNWTHKGRLAPLLNFGC